MSEVLAGFNEKCVAPANEFILHLASNHWVTLAGSLLSQVPRTRARLRENKTPSTTCEAGSAAAVADRHPIPPSFAADWGAT